MPDSTFYRGQQRWPRTALALALSAACSLAAQAQQGATLSTVEVVGNTPLPGIGHPLNELAAAVQSATRRDIEASGALELGDFMSRRLGSVHVNEVQGNPFQMDVSYRGYAASPLLGTPQGLSVYVDGVRMNQPFGDVVSWDLIPSGAIASMSLMPGSNPLFGLNTLGGALSVQTKDGRSDPGTSLQTTLGSHARRAVEFEHGGFNDKGLDWYVNANVFKDKGWRDDSSSDVRQLFGKLGWHDSTTSLKLTLAHADNQLNGNGLQELGLLAANRASVYTKPDITQNRSTLLSLAGTHAINDTLLFSGNAYYRDINTSTYNGDINEGALDQSVYQPNAAERAALTAAGYSGFPTSGANAANTPFPFWRCIGQTLLNDEPCKLPNAMAGDPPLRQVVTRTVEAGLRGTATGSVQWNAGVFRATNHDDILFVADSQSGYGYFKNFGQTRRQGLELGLSGQVGKFHLGVQYTLLDATYQSAETVNGSGNSSNSAASAGSPGQDGTIQITPGDRIPLIPRQMLKLFADYEVTPAFTLNGSMVAMAGSLARGNENNSHQADGAYYLGAGRSAGYAIFNRGAHYRVTPQLQLIAQVNNAFDTQYSTAAQLGSTGFDASGNFAARALGGSSAGGYPVAQSTFHAPGAPRMIWVGLRCAFS